MIPRHGKNPQSTKPVAIDRRPFGRIPLILAWLATGLLASSQGRASTDSFEAAPPGPYCGVYSVFGAIRVLGGEVELSDLLRPEYIGSRKGSSISELCQAASDQGVHANGISNMSIEGLRQCGLPVVLHFRSDQALWKFDHWSLFLGEVNGQANILDLPSPPRLMTFATLRSRWDGRALLISDSPIDLKRVLWPDRKRTAEIYFTVSAVILLAAILLRRFAGRCPNWMTDGSLRPVIVQAAGLLCLAAATGGAYHLLAPDGLLRGPQEISAIQLAHATDFMTRLRVEEVAGHIANGSAVIVDARLPEDYRASHIPGARNVPANGDPQSIGLILVAIPKTRLMVVYCQSAGCDYAATVAGWLYERGFRNVALFPGGWERWARYSRDKDK